MNSLAAILTSLILFAPVPAGDEGVDADDFHALGSPARQKPFHTPQNRQVHIEQRVIVRIAPAPRAPEERIQEVPSGACIPVDAIAGVRPADGNRLFLFMRDSRVLSAELDRSCNARDFYPGFYLERSEDGRLCQSRDWLQSRAGANCQITGFNRLVTARE